MSPTEPTSRVTAPHCRLTVDLDALAANYRHMREIASPAECAAVVKADGYGLGAVAVVRRLLREGCRHFFVAQAGEGLALRTAGIEGLDAARISVLGGLAGTAPETFIAGDLIPVLSGMNEIEIWRAAARQAGYALPAIVQIETGMNRLGLAPAEFRTLCQADGGLEDFAIVAVMSHLACADEPDHPLNVHQRRTFREAIAVCPGAPASLANSAGVFLGPAYHFDLVRPGIAIYGSNARRDTDAQMRPVVTLEAQILQTHWAAPDSFVGYGATWQADGTRRIATLGLGYADGYPRALGNRAEVALGSARAPVAGRISMDLVTIDITDLPEHKGRPGEWAELIGPQIHLDTVAALAGTLGYELLTGLGRRCERVYLEADSSGVQP